MSQPAIQGVPPRIGGRGRALLGWFRLALRVSGLVAIAGLSGLCVFSHFLSVNCVITAGRGDYHLDADRGRAFILVCHWDRPRVNSTDVDVYLHNVGERWPADLFDTLVTNLPPSTTSFKFWGFAYLSAPFIGPEPGSTGFIGFQFPLWLLTGALLVWPATLLWRWRSRKAHGFIVGPVRQP